MKAMAAETRIRLSNILFTTDFSGPANAAAPIAVALAKRYGAKLCALHVRPLALNPTMSPEGWEQIEEAIKIAESEQRRELAEEFAGMDMEILIKEGYFWSNLKATLASKPVDLIVMGTRGLSGVAKFILGSTTEEVFRQVTCPVLTVGPQATAEPTPGDFKDIVFATDFSPESLAAAPYALSFAQEFQANLTLLHVIEDLKPGELVRPEELRDASLRRLQGLVGQEGATWCTPKFIVEEGNAAEKILDVAHRKHADLIVLGVRKASGFPGAASYLPIATAHKVVSQAACPVLTVRG